MRLFSRQWCWRFLGPHWIRLQKIPEKYFLSVLAAVWRSGDCSIHLHPEWLFMLFQAVCWLCPWLSNFIVLYSIACISSSSCSLNQLLYFYLCAVLCRCQNLFLSLWKIQIFTNSIIVSNALERLCVPMTPWNASEGQRAWWGCPTLWGSAMLPSGYCEGSAGKTGHLYRALAFPSIFLCL